MLFSKWFWRLAYFLYLNKNDFDCLQILKNYPIFLWKEFLENFIFISGISGKSKIVYFKQIYSFPKNWNENWIKSYEKKQEQTKSNLVYVEKIKHDDIIPNMIRKNYDFRVGKFTRKL